MFQRRRQRCFSTYLNNLKSIGLWGALQVSGGWGLWLRRDGRESRSVARGGGVMGERADRWLGVAAWGERRGVRRERSGKWKERRKRNTLNEQKKEKKKKNKKVGNENLGENFCGKKKKSWGESLSYRVFYFFIFL